MRRVCRKAYRAFGNKENGAMRAGGEVENVWKRGQEEGEEEETATHKKDEESELVGTAEAQGRASRTGESGQDKIHNAKGNTSREGAQNSSEDKKFNDRKT